MEFFRTERFKKDFKHLPNEIQNKLPLILERFLTDWRHPSLGVKKMEGCEKIWELRITRNYRVTFQFSEGNILLRRTGTHNILRHP